VEYCPLQGLHHLNFFLIRLDQALANLIQGLGLQLKPGLKEAELVPEVVEVGGKKW
jgi:hypothetical protein